MARPVAVRNWEPLRSRHAPTCAARQNLRGETAEPGGTPGWPSAPGFGRHLPRSRHLLARPGCPSVPAHGRSPPPHHSSLPPVSLLLHAHLLCGKPAARLIAGVCVCAALLALWPAASSRSWLASGGCCRGLVRADAGDLSLRPELFYTLCHSRGFSWFTGIFIVRSTLGPDCLLRRRARFSLK